METTHFQTVLSAKKLFQKSLPYLMASNKSYSITINNNVTEKAGIQFLIESDKNFINPDKESRKVIMELMGIDAKYSRAFDMILVEGHNNLQEIIELKQTDKITLIELKTTKKKLPELPKGFFFGATQNEFDIAEQFGDQYKFCFVSLHEESLSYTLLSLKELEKIIKTKRVQYQINL